MPKRAFDMRLAALFSLAGQAIVRAAMRCLPQEVTKRVFYDSQDRYFDRGKVDLFCLAHTFSCASQKRQISIGDLLAKTFFMPSEKKRSEEEDRADQPVSRVLPHLYGRWTDQHGCRANCLGKAQLIAAFARLAGVPAMTVTPLVLLQSLYNREKAEAARQILRALEQYRIPLDSRRRVGLKMIRRFSRLEQDHVSWIHLAIVLKLRNGEWMLVDPNMGVRSVLTPEWGVDQIYRLLTKVSPVLPGVSIVRRSEKAAALFRGGIEIGALNCARVAEIAHEVIGRNLRKEEIVERLVASSFLDQILTWQEFSDDFDLPKDSSRRKKAICVLHEFNLEQEPLGESRKLLWFCFAREQSEEWLLDRISDDEANKAFVHMCYRFCTCGMRAMDSRMDVDLRGDYAQHPVLQFSLLEPGLAAATFGHVGLALGKSVETEAVLSEYFFDAYRLLYNAAALLDPAKSPSSIAFEAARILAQLCAIPNSARHVLAALGRRGLEFQQLPAVPQASFACNHGAADICESIL